MIRIRIDTFTFDKITKGVRANLIEKLSHFGGTAGLFNGFTIICIFEILAFCITLVLNCCKTMVKKSNVEIEEFDKCEDEKPNDSIKKTLDNMSRKYEELKQLAFVKRTKMIEKNQKLITMTSIWTEQGGRINENATKLEAKEKELALQRNMLDEDTKMIEALEKELKKKLEIDFNGKKY